MDKAASLRHSVAWSTIFALISMLHFMAFTLPTQSTPVAEEQCSRAKMHARGCLSCSTLRGCLVAVESLLRMLRGDTSSRGIRTQHELASIEKEIQESDSDDGWSPKFTKHDKTISRGSGRISTAPALSRFTFIVDSCLFNVTHKPIRG